MTILELYREEYRRHAESGDDPENARERIIEIGCPPEIADLIMAEEEPKEDEE